jgi:L-ascorbate metabolism protein UlaG (beta-lactamase superfamily)
MKFTYYGHSCFSVLACGKTLLFDPLVTGNPLARAIDVDRIEADFIFVSHGHFDHTTDVARIARRTGAKVLGNWEIFDWFKKGGLENVHPINPGGQFTFDFGTVKSFAAQHSSGLPDGLRWCRVRVCISNTGWRFLLQRRYGSQHGHAIGSVTGQRWTSQFSPLATA